MVTPGIYSHRVPRPHEPALNWESPSAFLTGNINQLNPWRRPFVPLWYMHEHLDHELTWIGVRSMVVEGERGSISSATRWFLMAGSGLTGAAILLSVDPIALSFSNWFTQATEAFEQTVN